jgi:hypothetical protein
MDEDEEMPAEVSLRMILQLIKLIALNRSRISRTTSSAALPAMPRPMIPPTPLFRRKSRSPSATFAPSNLQEVLMLSNIF